MKYQIFFEYWINRKTLDLETGEHDDFVLHENLQEFLEKLQKEFDIHQVYVVPVV